jgi:Sec-independent protein translocase protein TatA
MLLIVLGIAMSVGNIVRLRQLGKRLRRTLDEIKHRVEQEAEENARLKKNGISLAYHLDK